MAIYTPGRRDRHNRKSMSGHRSTVVVLSLTAMVDMFTVLTVFLLQNYRVEEIQLKKSVPLPQAHSVEKLRPSHVVVVTQDEIFLDETPVAQFRAVKESSQWLIPVLQQRLRLAIEKKKREMESGLKNAVKQAMAYPENRTPEEEQEALSKKYAWSRVTLQADKEIDFLTIKKVLYTIGEAGASRINFAVVPREPSQ